MGKLIFKDYSAAFLHKNDELVDMALGWMSLDIERYIKMDAGTPVDQGTMKAEVTQYTDKKGHFRVVSPIEYSATQEAGERDGIKFKNYTTTGTGPHWFQKSIDAITKNKDDYIHKAAGALGL